MLGGAGVPWGWEKEGGAGAEVRKGRAGDAFVRSRLWGFLFCPLKLAGDTEARRKQEVAPPRFVVAPRRHVVGLIARSRATEACSRDTSLSRVDLHYTLLSFSIAWSHSSLRKPPYFLIPLLMLPPALTFTSLKDLSFAACTQTPSWLEFNRISLNMEC